MIQASVNDQVFEVNLEGNLLKVNDQVYSMDIVQLGKGNFHVLCETRGYRIQVMKTEKKTKSIELKINGEYYRVQLKDKFDLLLEKMGIEESEAGGLNALMAPMPGLVVEIKVKVGDQVKKGDPLLILEAMKMENILKSNGDGQVKGIQVNRGDNVEKNQVLIEF